MNLDIDYEKEEYWGDWRAMVLKDAYSRLGPATAFYARVVKALRMCRLTSVYPDSGFTVKSLRS